MAETTITTVSYLGELFQTSKRPNALLRLLGGLQGGVAEASSKEFPIGAFWSVPAPSQPSVLEGANAPAPQTRSLTQATNVVQIFHEAVQVTYLAQSDKTVAGVVPIPQASANGTVQNPRSTEFQVMTTLEKIAQDANYSMLMGAYSNPGDPSGTALRTRGLMTALTTNVVDNTSATGTDTTKYRAFVEALVKAIIQQNGYLIDETFTLFASPLHYANVCAAYEAQGTIFLQPETTMAGVKIRKIQTRMGTLNLAMEPDMPDDVATTLSASNATGATSISVTSAAGLNVGDRIAIDPAGTCDYRTITAINGTTLTIAATSANHASGVAVQRGGSIAICNLGVSGIVGLPVPNKGILFEEPLYKQGSSDQTQIYGQLGIDHGPEWAHGKAQLPYGVSL